MLLGCKSDGGDNSPLLGKWITESCVQARNGDGDPVDIWLKNIFEFTSNRMITLVGKHYKDSDSSNPT